VDEETKQLIKGHSAAAENYGNFYGQNVFIAAGGVLLIVGTLAELDVVVTPEQVSLASIPIAVVAFIATVIQNYFFDRKLAKRLAAKQPQAEN